MKNTEQNSFIKENFLKFLNQFKVSYPPSVYNELDQVLSDLKNDSRTLKQKSEVLKKNLLEKFDSLWEKLKQNFHISLESYIIDFDKELHNIDILVFYLQQELSQMKEFECDSNKFLSDLNKNNHSNIFNEKNTLFNIFDMNPEIIDDKMLRLRQFLLKGSQTTEKLLNSDSFDEEFKNWSNSYELAQEKMNLILKMSKPFEQILEDLKSIAKKDISNFSREENQFSLKNIDSIQNKKEIPTKHIQKTNKEMFNPSEISILKIIHFKDNFYITCGWDGKINVTNILGKKTTMNIQAHNLPIRCIIKLQQKIYITTADDCLTKIWHLENEPHLMSQIDTKPDKIRCMISRGGLIDGSLIMGGDMGIVKFYDLALFKNEYNLKISDYGLTSIVSLDSYDKLLIGSSKGELFILEASNKKKLKVLNDAHKDWITSISYIVNSDGIKICTSSYDCFVKMWFLEKKSNELILTKSVKCDDWVLKAGYFKESIIVAISGKNLVFIENEKIIKKLDYVHDIAVNDFCLSKRDCSLLTVGHDENNNIKEWSD